MKNKECKITCDKKNVATILHTGDGLSIKLTKEGKEMFKECCGNDCC